MDGAESDNWMAPLHGIASGSDTVGALSRQLEVTVLEISRSGCLLESPSDLPPGTLVTMSVEVEGVEYVDAVRVVRSQPLQGAGNRYRIGAEFVWLAAPGPRSLRQLASRVGREAFEPPAYDP